MRILAWSADGGAVAQLRPKDVAIFEELMQIAGKLHALSADVIEERGGSAQKAIAVAKARRK